MKKENEFILELCQFLNPNEDHIRELIEGGLDYPYVLGQLLYNRVGSVAYYTLNKISLLNSMNREFRNTLKVMYDSSVIKTKSYLRALNQLTEILDKADFEYALLKGSYLSSLYPEGLRTSNDIDILIKPKDTTKTTNLLINNGFIPGHIKNGKLIPATRIEIINSKMNRGETIPLIKSVNLPFMDYIEIDINFSLDYKPSKDNSTISSFLTERQKLIKTEKGYLYTLSPEDFFIHLCVHLFKEATVYNWVEFGRDQSLYKYLDFYLLLKKYFDNEFINSIITKVKKYGLEKECYYSLVNCKALFKQLDTEPINKLINSFSLTDEDFMYKIISPTSKKVYEYKVDFLDWLFSSNRKNLLFELDT